MAYIYSVLARSLNNITAPIKVSCDKVYDFVTYNSDAQTYQPGEQKDGLTINLDGSDIVTKSRKINRMNPKKLMIEDYFYFFCEPTEMYPRLFLGSAYNASCYYTLKKNNIKYIINVSCEISNYYPNEIKYYRISIRDNNSESIKTYFQNSRKIIDNFLKLNDGNILVHCYMGASRSATIVADFISYKTKKDITEVLKTMTEKRPIINLTEKFTRDLIDDNLLSNY
jgi:hypothetical protein